MAEKCPVSLVPMKTWVQGGGEKECRPCMLGPVVAWYKDVLEQNGKADLSARLSGKVADPDVQPLHIGEELDNLKAAVEPTVRERLMELDCMAQSYEPTSAPESAAA